MLFSELLDDHLLHLITHLRYKRKLRAAVATEHGGLTIQSANSDMLKAFSFGHVLP